MYGSDAVEIMRTYIESRQAEVILALCFVVPLTFVLVLVALSHNRRLRKRLDELTNSVRGTHQRAGGALYEGTSWPRERQGCRLVDQSARAHLCRGADARWVPSSFGNIYYNRYENNPWNRSCHKKRSRSSEPC